LYINYKIELKCLYLYLRTGNNQIIRQLFPNLIVIPKEIDNNIVAPGRRCRFHLRWGCGSDVRSCGEADPLGSAF